MTTWILITSIVVQDVYREGNCCADWLANHVLTFLVGIDKFCSLFDFRPDLKKKTRERIHFLAKIIFSNTKPPLNLIRNFSHIKTTSNNLVTPNLTSVLNTPDLPYSTSLVLCFDLSSPVRPLKSDPPFTLQICCQSTTKLRWFTDD